MSLPKSPLNTLTSQPPPQPPPATQLLTEANPEPIQPNLDKAILNKAARLQLEISQKQQHLEAVNAFLAPAIAIPVSEHLMHELKTLKAEYALLMNSQKGTR